MRTFYCVISEFYSDGTIKANRYSRLRKSKPSNQVKKLEWADFYVDWFDSKERADDYPDSVLSEAGREAV